MSWLSRLIGRAPCREKLSRISQQVTKGLESTREEWFRVCVRQVEANSAVQLEQALILNTELTGAIVSALKAHQFWSVFSFIRNQRYLSVAMSRELLDLLCAGADTSKLPEIIEVMKEIMAFQDDFSRGSHLARRVAEHVMGQNCNADDVAVLTGLARPFLVSNNLVVAYAFGDQTTARKLEDLLNKCQDAYVAFLEEVRNPLAFLEPKSAA